MKRWLTIAFLLVWVGIAGAQTSPPMCSLTGNVANADGSPYVGVIKFYNPIVQVINGITINPLQVSTGTTPAGVINPISLPQGAFFQVTMCPNASSSSGCAATFTAIVPAQPSANFGNMAQGTNLIPSVIGNNFSVAGTLSVSGATTLAGLSATSLSVSGNTSLTTINPLPITMGSTTQIGDLAGSGAQTAQLVTINAQSGYWPELQLTNPGTGSGGQWLGMIASGSTGTSASGEKRGAVIGFYKNAGHDNTTNPYGAINFYTANGGTGLNLDMELFEDGGLAVAPGGITLTSDNGPGTINVSGSYYINGQNQFTSGSWTPTMNCASGNPTSDASGGGTWYTSGKTLFYQGYLGWTTRTGGSGQGLIGGLPVNAIDPSGVGWRSDTVISNATAPNSGTILIAKIMGSQNWLQVFESNFGSFGYVLPLDCAHTFANQPSGAYISGWYRYQ